MWKNTRERYGWPSKALHWSIGVLIIGLIGLGLWMVGLNYYHPWYHRSLELHKSLGMIVLALVAMKTFWRWWSPYPQLAATLTGWQRCSAAVVHGLLWAAMLLIPITGYGISTAEGQGVAVFEWFEIPAWLPKNDVLRKVVTALHEWIAYAAGLLVLMHAGAAIKHEFVDRDGTLRRMLW